MECLALDNQTEISMQYVHSEVSCYAPTCEGDMQAMVMAPKEVG